MGNCGNCSDCDCESGPSRPVRQEVDIFRALHAKKPKARSDPTPLSSRCTCSNGMNVPRYMCVHCIRSWVESQEEDVVLDQIQAYKDIGKAIAVERLEAALKEKLARG